MSQDTETSLPVHESERTLKVRLTQKKVQFGIMLTLLIISAMVVYQVQDDEPATPLSKPKEVFHDATAKIKTQDVWSWTEAQQLKEDRREQAALKKEFERLKENLMSKSDTQNKRLQEEIQRLKEKLIAQEDSMQERYDAMSEKSSQQERDPCRSSIP